MVVIIFTENRRFHNMTQTSFSQSVSRVLEPAISNTAYGLIAVVRHIVKHVSIRFLVALHDLISFGHIILTQIERRFSLFIDAVRGRGQTPDDRQRGSVSFFLEQLKDHKEEMIRRSDIH